MHQLLMDRLPAVVIKSYWERDNVLSYNISVDFVFEVNFWVILELFKMGRWEKCESMTLQSSTFKSVHHLNQRTIKHFQIICASSYEPLINLVIRNVFHGV